MYHLSKKVGGCTFLGMLLLLLFTSCKTNKRLIVQEEATKFNVESPKGFYNALKNHNLSFDWFSAKANVEADGQYVNASGQAFIKMCKDSICWMSVRKLGFEGYRVFANAQEYTVLDRFAKEYFNDNLDELKQYSGIALDFATLQEVMAGNIFYPSSSEALEQLKCNGEICTASSRVNNIDIDYSLDKKTGKIIKLDMVDRYGRNSSIVYDNYKSIPLDDDQTIWHDFPHLISIFAFADTDDESVVNIEFKKIELNIPKVINTSIPKRYSKIINQY